MEQLKQNIFYDRQFICELKKFDFKVQKINIFARTCVNQNSYLILLGRIIVRGSSWCWFVTVGWSSGLFIGRFNNSSGRSGLIIRISCWGGLIRRGGSGSGFFICISCWGGLNCCGGSVLFVRISGWGGLSCCSGSRLCWESLSETEF